MHIKKTYQSKVIIDCSVSLPNQGNLILLVGRNGQGKSTLLKVLSGTIVNESGGGLTNESVLLIGSDTFLIENLSLSQNLKLFIKINSIKNVDKLVSDYMNVMDLNPYVNKKVANISLGTREKLLLLMSLISTHDYILLDEPFLTLDPRAYLTILEMITDKKYLMLHRLIIVTNNEKIYSDFNRLSSETWILRDSKLAVNYDKGKSLKDVMD
ncbi:MAG: ATP-binding cassette domain-containing protein [Leuconostoc pseudomesenteroides]|uniref:ATP-binding cassette domain-containing protein n=1 Tax=Leuconostoc falkenbergense TaxID=2766470 RepID=UPI0024ADAC21|nr:ATP-binding cassette domain-containing protein [Leuconostoc falkenbergense]MDI6667439.1 ATP-binding cassette domain-containing protein [Leuconostoc falkenbergense]